MLGPKLHRRRYKLWTPPSSTEDKGILDHKSLHEEHQTGGGQEGCESHEVSVRVEDESAVEDGVDELDVLMKEYELQAAKDLAASKPAEVKKVPRMVDRLEDGLETKIDSKNKGWKLLAQMGYKDGEGLGVNKQGRKEPVEISLKRGRAGLGVSKPEKSPRKTSKVNSSQIGGHGVMGSSIAAFRKHQLNRYENSRLKEQIQAAQAVLEDLDTSLGIEKHHLWPQEQGLSETEESGEDTAPAINDLTGAGHHWETLPAADRILDVLTYLRRVHLYCFWCGCKFKDSQDMLKSCNGPLESDH